MVEFAEISRRIQESLDRQTGNIRDDRDAFLKLRGLLRDNPQVEQKLDDINSAEITELGDGNWKVVINSDDDNPIFFNDADPNSVRINDVYGGFSYARKQHIITIEPTITIDTMEEGIEPEPLPSVADAMAVADASIGGRDKLFPPKPEPKPQIPLEERPLQGPPIPLGFIPPPEPEPEPSGIRATIRRGIRWILGR